MSLAGPKTVLLHFLCLVVFAGVTVAQQDIKGLPPLAKMTVRVISEQGEPISDATVAIRFREAVTFNKNAWSTGKTDSKGIYVSEGRHNDMRLNASVGKEGFYGSGTSWIVFNDIVLGKLQPWNPVAEVILRPIGNPVALYAKRVQTEIPVLERPCGYDLEKGDWVAPYGHGVMPDFIFTAQREYRSRNDYEIRVKLSFSNPKDGFVKTIFPEIGKDSAFRWEREAPQAGYEQPVLLREAVHGNVFIDSFKEDDAYFFRVRAVGDNSGITRGNYGKISGGLRLYGANSKTCILRFFYYFNPISQDRNIEWDMKKNLFTGLKREEVPVAPY
jgi:hypothetical protein